jgi:hypothetical protein
VEDEQGNPAGCEATDINLYQAKKNQGTQSQSGILKASQVTSTNSMLNGQLCPALWSDRTPGFLPSDLIPCKWLYGLQPSRELLKDAYLNIVAIKT